MDDKFSVDVLEEIDEVERRVDTFFEALKDKKLHSDGFDLRIVGLDKIDRLLAKISGRRTFNAYSKQSGPPGNRLVRKFWVHVKQKGQVVGRFEVEIAQTGAIVIIRTSDDEADLDLQEENEELVPANAFVA